MDTDQHGWVVRLGTSVDCDAFLRILGSSPGASQWSPAGYEVLVVEIDASVAGLLVWRRVAPDEVEVLNLAVAPAFRRQGVAKALLQGLPKGYVFLEVRESNGAARGLYLAAGFLEVGHRPGYYNDPPEGAIVMRLQS